MHVIVLAKDECTLNIAYLLHSRVLPPPSSSEESFFRYNLFDNLTLEKRCNSEKFYWYVYIINERRIVGNGSDHLHYHLLYLVPL